MTLSENVAIGIIKLIGNKKAVGEAFRIMADKAIKWSDVLSIYKRFFKDATVKEIKIKYMIIRS